MDGRTHTRTYGCTKTTITLMWGEDRYGGNGYTYVRISPVVGKSGRHDGDDTYGRISGRWDTGGHGVGSDTRSWGGTTTMTVFVCSCLGSR